MSPLLARFRQAEPSDLTRATGEMEFDMDGFKDRTCSDSLDEVLLLMEERFGVESGPVQHNWKNPDRISKGQAFNGWQYSNHGRERTMMEWKRTVRREAGFRRCDSLRKRSRRLAKPRRTYAAPGRGCS